MSKMKKIKDLTNVQMKSCTKFAKNSKEPNFIEKDPHDSFSSEGTVRYGEEQDVDDL